MKTYLTLWFSSEGETPALVVRDLEKIGFKPIRGQYDMVYEWDRRPSMEDILYLADLVKKTLAGKGVLFKLESV